MSQIMYISIFLTIFLLLLALSLRLKVKRITKENTNAKKKDSVKDLLKHANQTITLLLTRNKKQSKKKRTLEQDLTVAAIPIKPEEFIAFQWIAAIFSAGLFYLITSNFLFVLLAFLFGYLSPKLWMKRKQKIRINQFNMGLSGMITSMISSLRAGFSFPQALQMIAEESHSPIKEEVELVLKKMRYGTSLEDALMEWKNRMPSEDLGLLVEAIIIQRQVGGNLAYLLNKIVETIRERNKIENQIKTLTAQGRLSGVIISLLPVGLGIMIYFINPEYMETLFTNPIGIFMLGAAGIGGVIGFIMIRKITTIEV